MPLLSLSFVLFLSFKLHASLRSHFRSFAVIRGSEALVMNKWQLFILNPSKGNQILKLRHVGLQMSMMYRDVPLQATPRYHTVSESWTHVRRRLALGEIKQHTADEQMSAADAHQIQR